MVPGARLASAGDTLHVHIPGENSPVIFTQAHRPGLFTTLAHKVGKPARHGITSSSAAAVYNVHTHAPDDEGTHVTDGAHPNRATDANSARGAEATQPNQVQHTLRPEVNQRAKLDALLYSSSPPRQKTEYRRAPAGKKFSAAKSTGDPRLMQITDDQPTPRPEANQRAKLDALLDSSSSPRQEAEYRRAPAGNIFRPPNPPATHG